MHNYVHILVHDTTILGVVGLNKLHNLIEQNKLHNTCMYMYMYMCIYVTAKIEDSKLNIQYLRWLSHIHTLRRGLYI